MGIFSRRDDDDHNAAAAVAAPVEPPHPALMSLDTVEGAPLRDLATAVLLAGFADAVAGSSEHEHEVQQRIEAYLAPSAGPKPDRVFRERHLWLYLDEAYQVLARSCLIQQRHIGNQDPNLMLTRRGRRALDSGDPAAWIDAPADPA